MFTRGSGLILLSLAISTTGECPSPPDSTPTDTQSTETQGQNTNTPSNSPSMVTASPGPTSSPTDTAATPSMATSTHSNPPTNTALETQSPTPSQGPTPSVSPPGGGTLFISQYLEGSVGYNKAIELFNAQDSSLDLGEFELWRITNGGDWAEFTLSLSGELAAGESYVIAHPEASDSTLLAQANRLDAFINFNGDDAIALARNGTIVDVIGRDGEDPGSAWSVAGIASATQNRILVRKAAFLQGSDNWAISSGTTNQDSQWMVLPATRTDLFGSHPHPEQQGMICNDAGCRIYIPEGPFLRGACNENTTPSCEVGSLGYHPAALFSEAPPQEIQMSGFWISETEVTVAQYQSCIDAGACTSTFNNTYYCNEFTDERSDDNPMNCIDWTQSQNYCQWVGGQLPTEAQWEKAARGGCELDGLTTQCEPGLDDKPYPWGTGSASCDLANIQVDGWTCQYGTLPVGSYPAGASAYGLLDAAGNVREWAQDYYASDYYQNSPATNPPGPESTANNTRIERGGAWGSPNFLTRTTSRNGSSESASGDGYGARCSWQ